MRINRIYKWVLIILTFLFIIVGVWSCATSIIKVVCPNNTSKTVNTTTNLNQTDFSSLSDGFAGLSWSIIGVFLLCLTLYYQRVDYKESEKTNNKQRFETTFFNMLAMLIQIRNSISCKHESEDKTVDGYHYFNLCINTLKSKYNELLDNKPDLKLLEDKIARNQILNSVEKEIIETEVVGVYEKFYKNHHACLGHYFRYIYHIIEFTIREREIYGDAKLYLSIIQSQLSDNELSLLLYNCLSKYAKKKDTLEPRFYNIMDSYGILENVDSDSLLSRNHHVLYPHTNFKFLNADEREVREKLLNMK